MGKNQQHKARQASKHSGGYGDPEAPAVQGQGVDASFHSAEWHEARLAALQVERPSWEDWKQKQKEDQLKCVFICFLMHCLYFFGHRKHNNVTVLC